MENKIEIEFRNISTAVSCPVCQRKFTTRLSVDYLSRQISQEISVICCSCAVKQINEGKVFNAN